MKILKKTLLFISLLAFQFLHLEAQSIELLFDHSIQETIYLSSPKLLTEEPFESTNPFPSPTPFNSLTIENQGNHPLLNCFPSINTDSLKTIQNLHAMIEKAPFPVLELYKIWRDSVIPINSSIPTNAHPLDLLNFHGVCPVDEFEIQFITLCQLLGIETRIPDVYQKTVYDFKGQNKEWIFFDPSTHQIYLNLNNQTLASSEDIMDDPFLALRTQHNRRSNTFDITKSWKEAARFQILEPNAAVKILFSGEELPHRILGFDLFPNEYLCFESPSDHPELPLNLRYVAHKIDLENRNVRSSLNYHSPIPIREVHNDSNTTLFLFNQTIELKPGEKTTLPDSNHFQITVNYKERHPEGFLTISGTVAGKSFPNLQNGENQVHLGTNENNSVIKFSYQLNNPVNEKETSCVLKVLNKSKIFDFRSPAFVIDPCGVEYEAIWWQISNDPTFKIVAPNLDRVESFSPCVTLSLLDETFINPEETYYFRVKGCKNRQWQEWSTLYEFSVNKPSSVEEVEFEVIEGKKYELNWERFAPNPEEQIEYLVFGSNSMDFIPSIYHDKQINTMLDDKVLEDEINDNLIAVIKSPKITLNAVHSYYRILAREQGQLSNPSSLIHVYDPDLSLPRNVLQVERDQKDKFLAKRKLFPYSEYSNRGPDPLITYSTRSKKTKPSEFFALSLYSLKKLNLTNKECPSHIDLEAWEAVRPWLMPDNHPCKAKLDRMATEERFILNPKVMKKNGFPRAERVGRWSRVCASTHRDMQKYYFKVYHDCEISIKYDWKRWVHRCEGAALIRKCIKKNNLQSRFKVPKKWIYYWPANGKQVPDTSRYVKKNFILVCDNMQICEHSQNQKLYKEKIDERWLKGIYIILQECGLYDSVYSFNIPFNKDGYICIIDTEYWNKWHIPFDRLTKCFSKKMRPYWKKLYMSRKIPDGVNSPDNLPRQDRRDH